MDDNMTDEILIETRLSKYNGIVLEVSYIMKNKTDESVNRNTCRSRSIAVAFFSKK